MTSSINPAWWERHGPQLPSHGIKAHTRRGPFGTSWWAGRWTAALERLVNPGRLARGRTYARGGRVLALDVSRDGVKAGVQGSRPEPYEVSITFRKLTDTEWERIIDAMSAEALYAARLLNGEMPEEIEQVFAAAGTSLFPAQERDMRTLCTCPDWANPCKHIAAVHYLLGERFDEDPFLIFLLRGRSQEEIVAALRARRAVPETDTEETTPADGPALLTADPRSFWQASPGTEEVALHFALPEADALPVKRLGAPSFVRDQAGLSAAMERMYRHISEYALLLALGDPDVGTA